jgi:hypothetical protein
MFSPLLQLSKKLKGKKKKPKGQNVRRNEELKENSEESKELKIKKAKILNSGQVYRGVSDIVKNPMSLESGTEKITRVDSIEQLLQAFNVKMVLTPFFYI